MTYEDCRSKVFVYAGEPPRPTDAELEILTVCGAAGRAPSAKSTRSLPRRKPTQYTTVLKMLQIMAEKGLVRRDEEQRAHIYDAAPAAGMDPAATRGRSAAARLQWSAGSLMLGALSARKTSREELAELRRLLDEYEKGTR